MKGRAWLEAVLAKLEKQQNRNDKMTQPWKTSHKKDATGVSSSPG